MNLNLHALPDDFSLNALGDTHRSPLAAFQFPAYLIGITGGGYLTDTLGNRLTDTLGNPLIGTIAVYLTDTLGNRLIGYYNESIAPKLLHALPDNFALHAE